MREIEIRLPPAVDADEIARVIDEAIDQSGLRITLRGTLKKFPGCIHWHAKNGRESGTLEVTLWPREHRCWFTIQDGRSGPWIDARITLLAELIGRQLNDT